MLFVCTASGQTDKANVVVDKADRVSGWLDKANSVADKN